MDDIILKLKKKVMNLNKKNSLKKILFTEADERILKAANWLKKEKIIEPILVGQKKEFLKTSKKSNIDISSLEIIENDNRYDEYIKKSLKKESDMKEALNANKNNYFACCLLQEKPYHGLIAGAISTTAQTFKPAIKIIGMAPETSIASSYFLMIPPDKNKNMLLFGDCALNITPHPNQRSEIANSISKSAQKYDIEPKIAMLSFSTAGSANHPLQKEQKEATDMLKKITTFPVDGEIQVDAALNKKVNKKKYPNSETRGEANVLIFPDLNSANIAYKLVERLGNYKAIGPISTGFKKPVNDLSRGCKAQDIIDLAIITACEEEK